jgi:hypothetical protein
MSENEMNPKKELLLAAGLNVLHFESREWLSKIEFWKDELRFFNNLLLKNKSSKEKNNIYEDMLIMLDNIQTDSFEELKRRITSHEKVLSDIEKSENMISDESYREKHREIQNLMSSFESDLKAFKKLVFKYEKKLLK